MTKEEELEDRIQKLENRLGLLEHVVRLLDVTPNESPIYGPDSNIHHYSPEDWGNKVVPFLKDEREKII